MFTDAYAVIPADTQRDIVTSFLPGWDGTRAWILARPLSGFAETFAQYAVEVAPGDAEAFAAAVPSAARIGTVTDTQNDRADVAVGSVRLSFDDIARAWVGGNA